MSNTSTKWMRWSLVALLVSVALRVIVEFWQDGFVITIVVVVGPILALFLFARATYPRSQRDRERRAGPRALFVGKTKRPFEDVANEVLPGARRSLGVGPYVDGDVAIYQDELLWVPSARGERAGLKTVRLAWREVQTVEVSAPRGILMKVWKLNVHTATADLKLLVFGLSDLPQALRSVDIHLV